MPKQKDLVGIRSGHLVVLAYAGRHAKGGSTWRCLCELCGNEVVLIAQRIAQGQRTCSTACGVSASNQTRSKHGMWKTAEYNAWRGIKERCYNPNNVAYHRYGGRGITMYATWFDDFQSFYAYIGPRPSSKHSIDRIDNDKGYEPDNVRWATKKEQSRNTRRNVGYTYQGETKTLVEWAEHFGMKSSQLRTRWYKGLRGDALFTPIKLYKYKPHRL